MGASNAVYVIEGPATIYFGTGSCTNSTGYIPATGSGGVGTLLGVTESGVTISTQLMTHRISTDEYGGNEGPPAELLILGATASVQGTLVKWGADAFAALRKLLKNHASGTVSWPAHGVFNSGGLFAFWVLGSKKSYYFPKCELASQPREWNIAALERRMNLNITAYANNILSGTPHIFYTNTEKSGLFPDCDTSVI